VSSRLWDAIVGVRHDIDLDQRWWHRFTKVIYVLTLGLTIAVSAFVIWDASDGDSFPAQRSQIKVITSLDKELSEADDSVPNVVPVFLKKDGRLGYDDGSENIQYMSDYQLEKTICSPVPLKHTEVIAAFLNSRDYTNRNTSQSITSGILQGMKAEEAKNLCWIADASLNKDWDKIIKYEFTTIGYVGALLNYTWPFIAWIVGINLVLQTIYYRGIVFVMVGPRKKTAPLKDDDHVEVFDTGDDDDSSETNGLGRGLPTVEQSNAEGTMRVVGRALCQALLIFLILVFGYEVFVATIAVIGAFSHAGSDAGEFGSRLGSLTTGLILLILCIWGYRRLAAVRTAPPAESKFKARPDETTPIAFCIQCGVQFPDVAAYCPKCDAPRKA